MLNVAHFAIPTHDLDVAADFYPRVLGAEPARRYDDRVTFKFFDHQVVCHLSPELAPGDQTQPDFQVAAYPRHYGITFVFEHEYDDVRRRVEESGWPYVGPDTTRFEGLPEKHRTFFMHDPTRNFIEFKWYLDPRWVY